MSLLSGARVRSLALSAGFDLVGFARAEPLPPRMLLEWLEAGMSADMDWMAERAADRLDPRRLLPNAQTVVALACNYFVESASVSLVASYARGRDYHATMLDRVRHLRRLLRSEFPGVADFGSVDHSPLMEKVWAARAGLGYVARNGCFVTPEYGSWVVLAGMVLDRAVESEAYGLAPTEDRCGRCRLCVDACPTSALDGEGRVDARRCLSYQSIENSSGAVPLEFRPGFEDTVFGCDVCQSVCPLNDAPVSTLQARFSPRPVASLDGRALAGLSRADYERLVPGTALARAGFDGLRRNAAYALGAVRDRGARPVLEALSEDASPAVREAAAWALSRLPA